MRYLKKYKIFESSEPEDYFKKIVNLKLIEDLKDLCLEFLDNGYKLTYQVRIGNSGYIVMFGHLQLKNNKIPDGITTAEEEYLELRNSEINKFEKWTNFYPEHFEKAKELLKINSIVYLFRIYGVEDGNNMDHNINKEAQSEVLERLRGMYPNENIVNI